MISLGLGLKGQPEQVRLRGDEAEGFSRVDHGEMKKGVWHSHGNGQGMEGTEFPPVLDEGRKSAGFLPPGEEVEFLKPGCWLGDLFVFPRASEEKVGREGLAGSKPGCRDTEDKARRQPHSLLHGPSHFPGRKGQRGPGHGLHPAKWHL